jgi:glycosyltransferase involved in cell wall biosynthesis
MAAEKLPAVVVSLRSDDPAMRPAFEAAGASVVLLGKRRGIDLRAWWRLRRVLAGLRPALVHAMTPQSAFWTALALSPWRRPPFLGAFLNTFAFDRWMPRLAEMMVVAPRLDGMLVNSRAAGRLYRERVSRRVPVYCIHNGVAAGPVEGRAAARAALGLSPTAPVVMTVGRLVPVKGQRHLVEAVAALVPFHPGLRLVLVGNGPLRHELEGLATRLGIAENLLFAGEHREPMTLLPAADVFALPSLSEGLPNALLEAMACGVACVATRVGGIPELSPGGRAIELVPPGDARGLASAIGRLLDNSELRRRRGAVVRRVALRRFSLRLMQDHTLALYRRYIPSSRSPR